jgi:hypothetical protein
MAVRVQSAALAHSWRWVIVPVVGWALFKTATAVLRHRTSQPSMPRMSDEWLRTNDAVVGRAPEL